MRDQLTFYEHSKPRAPLSIISIPTDLGSDARGLSENPDYLRAQGLVEMFGAICAEVDEEITIPCPEAPPPGRGTLKNLAEVAKLADIIADHVEAAARKNNIVVALGGDHSASIGTLRGARAAHDSLGIIWIDAHPDVHTHETTVTHNLHNMPAALALGEGHPELLRGRNAIETDHIVFVGLKDLSAGDRGEIEFLRRRKPQFFTMLDIARHALGPIFDAIDELSKKVEHVWIVMDMDSIDQSEAPGVAMPNTLGLNRREILSLAQYIGKVCPVAGVEIVEMLPENDIDGKTVHLAIELIARFLGSEYSWYSRYMNHYGG